MTDQLESQENPAYPEIASSPGLIFRRCREYHEISLDEASDSTKIGKNYLRALEEDVVSDFANIAYLKGFVRIYSSFLGLNPDDMIRMYEKLYGTPPTEKPADAASEDHPGRKRINWQRFLVPAVLLAAIVFLSVFMGRRSVHPPRQPQAKQDVPKQSAVVAPAPVLPAISSGRTGKQTAEPPQKETTAVQKPAEAPENQAEQQPQQSEGFILRMKAVQDGALQITLDESLSHDYTLTAGDVIEWKASRVITIDTANSGGIELELNGRPLRFNSQQGKRSYLNIGPQGLMQ